MVPGYVPVGAGRRRPRISGGWLSPEAGIIVLLAVAITLAAIIIRARDDAGAPSVPTTAQTASATVAGVTLTVPEAVFSGTSTRVTFEAPLGEAGIDNAVQVSIPADAIELSGFAADSGIELPPRLPLLSGSPVALVLPPIAASGDPVLRVTALEVQHHDGSSERVSGDWSLTLTPPEDRAAALRTETLTLASVGGESGVEVTIVSAVRSVAETRVVVRASWQGEPVLPVVGLFNTRQVLVEPRLDPWSTRGDEVTLVLPPSDFGEAVSLPLHRWAEASSPLLSVVDLHPLVTTTASAIAPDHILVSGRDYISGTTIVEEDGEVTLGATMPEASIGQASQFARHNAVRVVVLPSGDIATVHSVQTGRRPAGGIESDMGFDISLSDLDGLVVLLHPHAVNDDAGVTGAWSGRLLPE